MSALAHTELHTAPEDLEARIAHHSIAPGRVAKMDLGMHADGASTPGSDRSAAIGALIVGAVIALAMIIGLA
ncbi:hypothetical protein CZ771_10940 [Actinomycetales bacterium JB111]|nr:hypothetical protein CZ771_10940 [Actinomycetales bacterium JB111]